MKSAGQAITAKSNTADAATVMALTVLAGAGAALLHEALGHGSACLLAGGHNTLITAVSESCTVANGWIDAAGTLVNLAAGGVCWWWMRRVREAPRLRYFLWLLMAFNLLDGAGYFLYSGVGGIGDWAVVISGLHPAWPWRTGLAVGGAILYVAVLWLLLHELVPFLPTNTGARRVCARRLMLLPYFTYGVFYVIAAVFNPISPVLIAESAAAAAFGGTSGLWWGMEFVRYPVFGRPGPKLSLERRSRGWILAGVCVAAAFIAVIGPGIRP
ncbi:MAG: hypothetical protein ACRD1Y_02980 [Terriglobales bacterium]